MPFRIVSVVEGHGEVRAVPELLRRLIAGVNPPVSIEISSHPVRQPRETLIKPGGLEAAVSLAANEVGENGAILIILDSEADCPAQLAPELVNRARTARPDKRIWLVLAHHEFEAWFLAAASSLKGCRGLSHEIEDHDNPESVHGCKEWLEGWMPATSKYSERIDQPALAAVFDLQLARRSASFDKFCRQVEAICEYAVASAAAH